VFGGSGFIGKHVVRALAKRGYRVRIAIRRPHMGAELRVMGDVGQIQLVQANVRFPQSIDAALEDADAVVTLVSTMYEGGKQTFEALNVEAAQAIAESAAKHGIKRIVQMSALGAGAKGARFARTKYRGERAVLEAAPSATILRPSVVFGPEDTFFNRFAQMATVMPFLPLIGGGKTKFQPIFVGDLADSVAAALEKREAQGRIYELGGPHIYTLKQLLQFITTEIDRPRALMPLPFVMAHPIGLIADWFFKLLPWNPPITGDQVTLLKRDNIVGAEADAHAIQDLGVMTLESIEAIVPDYLWRFRPYGQFQTKQNPV
jgi:NADH dehydrogenase